MNVTTTSWGWPLLLAGLAGLAACGSLPEARMQRPEGLSDHAQMITLDGLGGGTRGRFRVAGADGEFERRASRLGLLDNRVERDRVSARYRLQRDGAAAAPDLVECRGGQTTLGAGILAAAVQRFGWRCDCAGAAPARLELSAPDATVGPRHERQGRYQADGLTLGLRSEHRLQGTPLPLAQPAGYVFTHDGRVVGALDLAAGAPRLWRPAQPGALQDAVTRSALALALLWDPAGVAE